MFVIEEEEHMHKAWKIAIVVLLAAAVVVAVALKNSNTPESAAPRADRQAAGPAPAARPEKVSPEPAEAAPAEAPTTAAETKPLRAARPAATPVKPKAKPTTPVPPEPSGPIAKLIDLGAGKCIPCKMMAPILEELSKEYKGKLEVVVIDVWENREAAEAYGIQSIPTQIFYDAAGRELSRHVGFFSKADILARFRQHGIALKETQR
jgi:thioredoxin 1